MKEAAWIVRDFVNQNDAVIECDPLKGWLEEYQFFLADWVASRSQPRYEPTNP